MRSVCGPVSGYVLAGGRSSRMGQDKARLPWRGATFLHSIAEEISRAVGSVTMVGGEPVTGIRHIPDLWSGWGPIGGIATALLDSKSPYSLVTACDMPELNAAFLRTLVDQIAGNDAVVPVTADGRIHPLCAVWSHQSLPVFQQAIAVGEHTLRRVVDRLNCVFTEVEPATLRNINTPGEYAEAVRNGD